MSGHELTQGILPWGALKQTFTVPLPFRALLHTAQLHPTVTVFSGRSFGTRAHK
jgi:hypothetical protein